MSGDCFKIEHVKRRVFRTSFMKNVAYAMILADASPNEDRLRSYAECLHNDGYEILEYSDYAKGMIVARKSGVLVICSREMFVLNVHVSEYKNYEHFKAVVLAYFKQYSEVVQTSKISNLHILKTNEFKLDRSKPDMENVTQEQFEQVVCSESFIKHADENGQIQFEDKDDGISRYAKSSITEGEKRFTIELVIAAFENKAYELEQVGSRLDLLNDAAYDMWNAVLSDTIKKSMKENEGK